MISGSSPAVSWAWAGLCARRALLTGALCLHTVCASAEDAETRTLARDLATQGAQAFDARHYDEARDFFRRAHELVPAPSIALLEARSLVGLGKLLEAIDLYEQTARFKLSADSPEAYSQAVVTAHGEVEEVRKRLPRLKLTLLGLESGDTPQVTMDDKPTPTALLGVERPMNPGQHRIVVRVAGEERASRELTLLEGESYQIDLGLRPPHESQKSRARVEALALPMRVPVRERTRAARPSLRIAGYVGLGIGAVGLGVGTYTGLVALHHKSELDSVCHPDCPRSAADDLSGFRSNRTVSWISYGFGFAAAAAGVALLTFVEPSQAQLAIRVLPGGLQIGGRL